jgi:hypothetical protein
MGNFVKTSCEVRDKELSKWDWSDPGQDFILTSRQKGFLSAPPCRPIPCHIHLNKIHCPFSSDKNNRVIRVNIEGIRG